MVRSMTGYGRGQEIIDGMDITVEIKSVNHRYFEFSARAPRQYMFLEEKLKAYFQQVLSRGKAECFVQIEMMEESDYTITLNHSVAEGYLKAFNEIKEKYGIENDITASSLARFNDVLSIRRNESDEDKIWNAVKTVASKAAEGIVSMREAEGKKLREDVLSRIDTITRKVRFVEERSPETVREYQQKLLERINEAIGSLQVDEQRILTEAAIYADKVAVAEETVRLMSHMQQLKEFFECEEAIGRKMDFLVQEMNREANTIGSKAQDVEIARCVLDIKAEIEKIREQIQNIE